MSWWNGLSGDATPRRTMAAIAAVYAGLLAVFCVTYLPLLPNGAGGVGGDYSMFMPDLLAGYYWILHNGYLTIPWFSPAECGGVPFFADPQVGYFSVPQLLTLWVSPLRAIQAMFLLFASVGFFGAYGLMRISFRSSVPAALLAAALFMLNGFYSSRILVGHMTFHAFMLLPVAAAALLRPPGAGPARLPVTILRLAVAAGCFAYLVQAGSFVILPQVLLSLLLVLLIHVACFGWRGFPLQGLVIGGGFGLLLSAGKLAAVLAFVAQFPRDNYPLPGIAGLSSDIGLALMTLFFWVPAGAPHAIVNSQWLLERHEWEYGVTPVPLLLMLGWLATGVARRRMPGAILPLAILAVLLLVPVALNWYQPGWNAILKALPLIGSSSNLLRWFAAYILPAILGGALALDVVGKTNGRRMALAAACVAAVAALSLTRDLRYYGPPEGGGYQVAGIEAAYRQADATDTVPPVTAIALQTDGAGHLQITPQRDDALIRGYSQLLCYQPIFGYRLERFPMAPLRPGPVLASQGHLLNVKDPACYLFPAENQCRPGDQFDVLERARAEAFLDYRPYPFALPFYAAAVNWVSGMAAVLLLGSALLCMGILCVGPAGVSLPYGRFRRRPPAA